MDKQLGAHNEKILRENTEAPDGCATAVVNKDFSVYLELQGAENVDAWHEKRRKKEGEHPKLQHAASEMEAQTDMSEPGHAAPLMLDQRSQNEERFAYEVEAQPDMGEPGLAPSLMPDQVSQIEERFAFEVAAEPDMTEPGHAPPLMPDQGSQIEERFLAFLKGYEVNGHQLYKIICRALAAINCGDMSINYKHLQQFDPILANTIRFFYDSVQTALANAAKVFLKEEVGFQCENPLVKICDRPMPHSHRCSFMLLKDFWSLPGRHPSEECDIYYGGRSLSITKTTRDGRIVLLNLLRKIFGSFEKGYSWNGDWTIKDVMLCPETYQVEIMKPFCKKCNYSTMRNDILVVSTIIVPEFKCGGRFPAFFGHLDGSLRKFIIKSHLSAVAWKKFRDFVTTHFALKSPLTRSRFLDNLNEMCLGAKLLQIILSNWSSATDWRLFRKGEHIINPILENNGPVEAEDTFDAEVVQALAAGVVQANDAEIFDETKDQESQPFEGTLEGLLLFSRHIKQYGFKGSKDNKGERGIQELSEVNLVLSHFLEMLPEILKALIYKIDSEELKYNADDYDKFLVMFREIFEVYNTPEVVPSSYQ